jgi:hypothetical protein
MTSHDDQMDRDVAAALFDDAERAIPAWVTVLPAVQARLRHAGGRRGRRAVAKRRNLWRKALLLPAGATILIAALALSPLAQATTGPIANGLLREFGILPADQARVALPGGLTRATSSGYTVTLVGAYGDQFHTVLFFRTHPMANLGALTVTDESRAVLGVAGGAYFVDSIGPDAALSFSALAPGRHQLTAHFDWLEAPPGSPADSIVRGDWTLRFPLDVGTSATVEATPAAGDLGRVHVVVVRVASGDGLLYLELHTTDGTIDQLLKEPREGQSGPPNGPGALKIQILDAAGHQLAVVGLQASADGKRAQAVSGVTWSETLRDHGAGAYRLVMTFEGHRFESHFTITIGSAKAPASGDSQAHLG